VGWPAWSIRPTQRDLRPMRPPRTRGGRSQIRPALSASSSGALAMTLPAARGTTDPRPRAIGYDGTTGHGPHPGRTIPRARAWARVVVRNPGRPGLFLRGSARRVFVVDRADVEGRPETEGDSTRGKGDHGSWGWPTPGVRETGPNG